MRTEYVTLSFMFCIRASCTSERYSYTVFIKTTSLLCAYLSRYSKVLGLIQSFESKNGWPHRAHSHLALTCDLSREGQMLMQGVNASIVIRIHVKVV